MQGSEARGEGGSGQQHLQKALAQPTQEALNTESMNSTHPETRSVSHAFICGVYLFIGL